MRDFKILLMAYGLEFFLLVLVAWSLAWLLVAVLGFLLRRSHHGLVVRKIGTSLLMFSIMGLMFLAWILWSL